MTVKSLKVGEPNLGLQRARRPLRYARATEFENRGFSIENIAAGGEEGETL